MYAITYILSENHNLFAILIVLSETPLVLGCTAEGHEGEGKYCLMNVAALVKTVQTPTKSLVCAVKASRLSKGRK